jgi:uncharacterized delta-60 repeat protein
VNGLRVALWATVLLAVVAGFDAEASEAPCFKNHYILGDPCNGQAGTVPPTSQNPQSDPQAAPTNEWCGLNAQFRELSAPVDTADGRRLTGVLVGQCIGVSPYHYAFGVRRVNADGTMDSSFNRGGLSVMPIWGYYEFAVAIAVQSDGKILVGGNAATPRTSEVVQYFCYPAFCQYYPAVIRLNQDGTPDRTFNGTGKIVLAIGNLNSNPTDDVPELATLTGLALDAEGRISIMAGDTPIARLLADGTLDSTFAGMAPPAREFTIAGEIIAEYYAASLDHYFMTWLPQEIAALEGGDIPGWTHTGRTFKVYSTPEADTSPVCRFYIPPEWGDSHFLGLGETECAQTRAMFPAFILEAAQFMYVYSPTQGVCPTRTTPVYRVFDNRPDVNHRYITEQQVRDHMLAEGWVAEGQGPDAVAMCAPQ